MCCGWRANGPMGRIRSVASAASSWRDSANGSSGATARASPSRLTSRHSMSPSPRLRNACIALTGRTPVQLLHARMLLEAKRQLLYTDEPVRSIAYALGFTDAAYFTRFFSRHAQLSPRAFRLRGPHAMPMVPER